MYVCAHTRAHVYMYVRAHTCAHVPLNDLCMYVHAHTLRHIPVCDPMTVAPQAPLSMGFPRQENRSGLPFPSPGNLSDPGIKPGSPALQADALLSEPPGKP